MKSFASKYEKLLDFFSTIDEPFSVLAFQEIWSIGRQYPLPGYHPIIFNTRDQNADFRFPNCGGGTGFFVNSDLTFSVLNFENQFIVNVYESSWIQVNLGIKNIIVGNIYRPDTHGKTDPHLALRTHLDIISQIKRDPKLKKKWNCFW